MLLIKLIVSSVVFLGLSDAEDFEEIKFDMDMFGRAFDIVCWYEYIKNFPPAPIAENLKKWFVDGRQNCESRRMYHKYQPLQMKDNPSELKIKFAKGLNSLIYWQLPEGYHASCNPKNPDETFEPDTDESTLLEDGGKNSAHRWLATCLLRTLRQKHGDVAIESAKNQKGATRFTQPVENWRELMLERENKYRELHGASPLKLDEGLNAAAEEYAIFLTTQNGCRRCSCRVKRECEKDGQIQGENLCFGDGMDFGDMMYACPSQYYSQGKDYPMPAPNKGHTTKISFETGSYEQYAQMLWNSTEFVGYGYAGYEGDGRCDNFFLVARYYPMGGQINFEKEDFLKNVFPQKG